MAANKKPDVPAEPMTLLAITASQRDLERLIAENGGVMSEDVEAQWDALGHSREEKDAAYYARRRALLATQAACEAESKRLAARAKRCAGEAEALETRMLIAMQMREQKTLVTTFGQVTRTASTPAAVVTAEVPALRMDYEALPEWARACVKVTPEQGERYEWDKVALKDEYLAREKALTALRDAETPDAEAIAAAESALQDAKQYVTVTRGEHLIWS